MVGKIRVMAVDDSPFSLEMIKAALNVSDIEVCGTALNGHSALEIYRNLKPDLVTMDITMPDMDGLSCSEQILAYDNQARIIILSSMRDEALQNKGLGIGIKAFLQKPIKPEELLATIRLLQNSHAVILSADVYGKSFITAFKQNLKDMAKLDCQIEAYLSREAKMNSLGLAVIIGVTGGKQGRVVFDLAQTTALALAARIYGRDQLNEDEIINAITEFVNISCGHCNSGINNCYPGADLRLTPPSVAIGNEMSLVRPIKGSYSIDVATEMGPIQIHLDLSGGEL